MEIKKRNTIIFTIFLTIFSIISTLVIIIGLLVITTLVLYRLLKLQSSTPLQIAMPIIFIVSIILDFLLYAPAARWFIKVFKLEDKILPQIRGHYASKDKKSPKKTTHLSE